jgi:putative ribosome biogenesis GTPase RsgA
MSTYINNARAFDDWYRNSDDGSYWCTYHECSHLHESDCEVIEDFANDLTGALVSDDAVDMEIWRATHSVEAE